MRSDDQRGALRQRLDPAPTFIVFDLFSFLYRSAAWFLRKLIVAVVVVGLTLTTYATWLFLQDNTDLDAQRVEGVSALSVRRETLVNQRTQIESKIESLRQELTAQQDRAERAKKIAESLTSLQSRWKRWFGDRQQQELNTAQIQHLREVETTAREQALELQRAITQTAWGREDIDLKLQTLNKEMEALRQAESPVIHYLNTAWRRARWYVWAGVILYFFGPWLARIALYFGVAPFFSRGKALCFASDLQRLPEVTTGEGSIAAPLWPGEVLVVRSKYLGERSNQVERRSRLLLDWRLPLTSVATGLFNVVELHHRHASGEQRVALAGSGPTLVEFALLHLSEGSSLILRPRFLAGFIQPVGGPLAIRSRWRLFHRHSWITLQFRFLEFAGPCRLIIASPGGLKVEHLAARETGPAPVRRVALPAAIGFTPNLDRALVRVERLSRYLRGSPLFELCFSGPGLFLTGTAQPSATNRFKRFWSARSERLMRVFGA